MRQSLQGSFPGGPSLQSLPAQVSSIMSLQDLPSPPLNPGPARSDGATAIAQPQFGSSGLARNWTLLSLAITGYLGLINDQPTQGDAAAPLYGKFGKILFGLSLSSYLPPGGYTFGSSGQPWSVTLQSLPTDASLIDTLWDPAQDELPPHAPLYFGGSGYGPPPPQNQLLPVAGSLLLPSPMQLDPGAPPSIGIWMEPSLLGFAPTFSGYAGLTLFYASYALNYDDGITPRGI